MVELEPGDTVLATRERSGSWMKLVDWDGKGACNSWVFRGDGDDLFEFVSACDAPSVYEDSDASSDDEVEGLGTVYDGRYRVPPPVSAPASSETDADTVEDDATSGDDPGGDQCGHDDEGDPNESDAADSSDAFLGASCECEAEGRRWKSHGCSMDYSQ
jgi:hypothetical protein